nr:alcohol dehydrogenase catalytic domain-containing protein [Actinoplanes polyasparticus]
MQAAVITKPNATSELQNRPIPEPAPGQALVRVHACGICGTDLWMAQNKLSYRPCFPWCSATRASARWSPSAPASPPAR